MDPSLLLSPTFITALLLLVVFVVVFFVLAVKQPDQAPPTAPRQPLLYQYAVRPCIMSPTERNFFQLLAAVYGESYHIVPQARLSSFLDHEVRGQSWSAAFQRINRKSVDFLLCEIESFRPVVAIELDDSTHLQPKRMERDDFVNTICANAGIPLVRYTPGEWTIPHDIHTKLEPALRNHITVGSTWLNA